MIKACLFDLDGVIVDTARYHYIAWRELAAEMGFEFSEADNQRLKGISRTASLEVLLEIGGLRRTAAEQALLAESKNARYLSFIRKLQPNEVLPGAREFLECCKAHGFATALGSASKNARTILERLELTGLFDAVIDGAVTTRSKPDPEVFLKGAAALNVAPAACAVFEDAAAGVEAALAAGMKCVGIGSPAVLGRAHRVVAGLHEMNIDMLKSLEKA